MRPAAFVGATAGDEQADRPRACTVAPHMQVRPIPRGALFAHLMLAALPTMSWGQTPQRPTGFSVAGLPAVNYDADEGVGYGALLQLYDYGPDGAQPYRYSLQPTAFFTTRGRRDVILFVDAPHLLPDPWRLGGSLAREQQLATPFYGVGNASVFDSNATKGPNTYYYRYGRTVWRANADVQHDLGVRAVRLLVGAGMRAVTIRPVPYDSGTTLLAQQVGRSTLPARNTVNARVGLVVDTRDSEIRTHTGNWSELLVQRAGKVLGGDEAYTRVTANIRQFVPLGPSITFAERVVLQTVRGSPFVTELSTVQSSFRDDEALGGATSIRGVPRNRYIGKGVAFSGGAHVEVGPSFVVTGDVAHSSQTKAAVYIGIGYLF